MAVQSSRLQRDLRLDFFRGLSLIFIFIDHIRDNLFTRFTLHSIAFNDAAEVFIFISGYTAALVYGRSLREKGVPYAVAHIYRRVWQIYVAHIFVLVIFITEIRYVTLALGTATYTDEMGVGEFLRDPYLAIVGALTLTYQPTFLDVLPLYIVLLASFPLVLILLRWHRLLPLFLSGAVYMLTLHYSWSFHPGLSHHNWEFNPLAWQFLFVIGATASHGHTSGRPLLPTNRWIGLAALVLAAPLAIIKLSWTLHWVYSSFPPLFYETLYNYWFEKTNLSPVRLANFLLLAIGTLHLVRPNSAFLRSRWAQSIVICGQQSLNIFCLGLLLSVLAHFLLAKFSDGFAAQAAVNLLGIGTMIGVAAVLQWFKFASRRLGAPRSSSIPSTPSE